MGRMRGNVLFMSILPGEGMYYQYFVDRDNPNTAKRSLSTSDTKAILRALNRKHHCYKPRMKVKLDEEIATLITSGASLIKSSCMKGQEVPEGADSWGQAKKHTFLEGTKDITVYRFALKLLEARNCALERSAERALSKGIPQTNKYDARTTKALDGFMAAVVVAAVMFPIQALDLSAFMDGDLAKDLVPSEDDAEDDAIEYDDDVETGDNLSIQPMAQPMDQESSTQDAKLPKTGDWWDVYLVQDNVEHDADNEIGGDIVSNDATGEIDSDMDGEQNGKQDNGLNNETNDNIEDDAEYENDDEYEIDDKIDISEDEFGLKRGHFLKGIEERDAFEMHTRATSTMEDFVNTPIAKQIMADRAPILAGLPNATMRAEGDYEHDLEKHLLRRADLTPEQMQHREDTRWRTWQPIEARYNEKLAEKVWAHQAARLSLSACGGQTEQQEDVEMND